jgi:hypothetical protein
MQVVMRGNHGYVGCVLGPRVWSWAISARYNRGKYVVIGLLHLHPRVSQKGYMISLTVAQPVIYAGGCSHSAPLLSHPLPPPSPPPPFYPSPPYAPSLPYPSLPSPLPSFPFPLTSPWPSLPRPPSPLPLPSLPRSGPPYSAGGSGGAL